MTLHLAPDLDVPIEYTTEAIAIIGRRGSGKTNTAVVAVEEMIGAGQQVVVVDTVGVWWGLRAGATGGPNGLDVVIFGGQHADVPLEESAGKVIANAIVDHDLSAIIDTSLLSKAAARRFLLAFVTELYHRKTTARTPLHVVFDEADELAPQRSTPDTAKLLGAMEDFVRRGRSRGLGVTLVTQRPAVLNKDVLTQVEVLIAMQLTGPLDVKAVGEWVRLNASEDQGREVFSTLSSLQAGEGWVWSPSWLKVLQRVRFRKRHTFDSSVTPKIGEAVTRVEARVVDLTKLGEQIAATVENAKADDPKVLRAKVAELEKHLRERPEGEPVETIVERVVEVPVLTDADRDMLTNQATLLHEAVLDLMRTAIGDITVTADKLSALAAPALAAARPAPHVAQPVTVPVARTTATTVVPVTQASEAAGGDAGALELNGAQRKMLTVLAQFPHLSVKQIAMRSTYSFKSSSFSANMAALRRAGYLTGVASMVTITAAGREALGDFDALPTGRALVEHWMGTLKLTEANILRELLSVWPGSITTEEISERTGYSMTSSSFSAALASLKKWELAAGGKDGMVASQDLGEAAAA